MFPCIRMLTISKKLIAQGKPVNAVCRLIVVTQPTYHRLRHQYSSCRPMRLAGLTSSGWLTRLYQ